MFFYVIVVSPIITALLYLLGVERGQRRERRRCASLCEQSWYKGDKLSPTGRRIYRSILDGREDLISEDEFFGPPALAGKERA